MWSIMNCCHCAIIFIIIITIIVVGGGSVGGWLYKGKIEWLYFTNNYNYYNYGDYFTFGLNLDKEHALYSLVLSNIDDIQYELNASCNHNNNHNNLTHNNNMQSLNPWCHKAKLIVIVVLNNARPGRISSRDCNNAFCGQGIKQIK